MKRVLLSLCLLLLAGRAAAQTVAIENATIYTDAKTKLEGATIVIKDGVISALGVGAPVPAEAKRVDGKGKIVTAGLIDAYTNLGLSEVSMVRDTVEGSFGGSEDTIHAAYRVIDGYNPSAVTIPVARAGGVTSALAVPRGGLVSGSSALISLGAGVDPLAVSIQATAFMHATLGEGSLGAADGSRGYAVESLRELLDDAAQYAKRKADYEKGAARDFAASRLDLEALIPVVQGRQPLMIEANRASDILAALRLAADLKLKIAIHGGNEGWKVAAELAKAKVPVILSTTDNLPSSFDSLYNRDDNAKLLAEAGVPLVISVSDGAADVRRLRQSAGIAVSRGLSWEAAFYAITQGPAEALGVKNRGALAVGNPADVVVWSGDPLELSSRALHVFCNGVEQSLESHQTRLLQRYRSF